LRNRVRGLVRFGLIRSLRVRVLQNSKIRPKYNLAICAIVKNEGRYFAEWIEYHQKMGTEKFYIYDNESDDNTREILKPFVENGLVEYVWFPGKHMQQPAYEDCLTRHRADARWIAFIDLDEFIVPMRHKSILEYLKDFENFSAVEINWLCFGSGGAKTRMPGTVMERFRAHSWPEFILNRHVKSIVNPRCVATFVGAHEAARISGKTADSNGNIVRKNFMDRPPVLDKIRINHYAIKSYEEFLEKRGRGRARRGPLRSDEFFNKYDRNEIIE